MTPRELDLLIQGAYLYERPDGTRYASWSDFTRFGVEPYGRSGKLTAQDIQTPASVVLERINAGLIA
jgi:hypothetical protein